MINRVFLDNFRAIQGSKKQSANLLLMYIIIDSSRIPNSSTYPEETPLSDVDQSFLPVARSGISSTVSGPQCFSVVSSYFPDFHVQGVYVLT